MTLPDLSNIDENAEEIVGAIGRESVEVYRFLSREFARGSIRDNGVFQFTYRSFYRLDNAGVTPDFKREYFALLEDTRGGSQVDIRELTRKLFAIPNRKGHQSLQFSFVTKLANTVNSQYPIYDANIASVFSFRAPYNYKAFEVRLDQYMGSYDKLRLMYAEIIDQEVLQDVRQKFRTMYAATNEDVPEIKVLDFIFWSAGKLSREAEEP